MLIYATGSVIKQAKTRILINRNTILHIHTKENVAFHISEEK